MGLKRVSGFLSALVLSVALFGTASAEIHRDYPIHLPDPKSPTTNGYTFQGEIYTIISHVVSGWNTDRVTLPGVKKLVDFAKSKQITRFGFVSAYGGGDRQFFEPNDVNFIVESSAGQHNLSFPNGKAFLVSGGNLSLCLCEALRDLIRLTDSASAANPLPIFLVSDAIYDDRSYWPVPSPRPSTSKFTLARLAADPAATDAALLTYISDKVVGTFREFCPGQNYYGFPNIDKSQITFGVYRDGRHIGDIGNGQKRRIDMVVVETKDLDRVLKGFGVDKYYPVNSPL